MLDNFSLVEACLVGATGAWRKYERWSNGVGDAAVLGQVGGPSIPEGLIQASVAEAIYERALGVSRVTLEQSIRAAGVPTWPADGRRIDIVAWNEKGAPCALIEIKRGLAGDGLKTQFEYCRALAAKSSAPCMAVAVSCRRFRDEEEAEGLFSAYIDGIKPQTSFLKLRGKTSEGQYGVYGVAVYAVSCDVTGA